MLTGKSTAISKFLNSRPRYENGNSKFTISDKISLQFCRGGSRTPATSKMEHFVIIVNG